MQNIVNVQQNDNHDTVETRGSDTTDHVNETSIKDNCQLQLHLFVVTSPLPRDGDTVLTAIQVHAVNLIEIRLGERWQSISNQSLVTGSPTANTSTTSLVSSSPTCWRQKLFVITYMSTLTLRGDSGEI